MIEQPACNVQEVNLDEYDAGAFGSALQSRAHAYIQMDKQYEEILNDSFSYYLCSQHPSIGTFKYPNEELRSEKGILV